MADQTPIERAASYLYPGLGGPNADWELTNARAALTAALGSVEEMARVIDPTAPWWLPIDHAEALHCRVARAQAEALHAWLLVEPEMKEAGRG